MQGEQSSVQQAAARNLLPGIECMATSHAADLRQYIFNSTAQTIPSRSIALVGQARMQDRLQGDGNRSTPVLKYKCTHQEVA